MKNKKSFSESLFSINNVKDDKLNNTYRKKVIDNISYKKIDKEEFLNLSIPKNKTIIFFIFILLCMFIFLIRIFYLQIYEGDYYRKVAEGNRIRTKTIKASRGLMYDRNNKLLVKNVPDFILTITPSDLSDNQTEIFNKISNIINISSDEIEETLAEKDKWQEIKIASGFSYEEAIKLIILSSDWPGVECKTVAIRQYEDPEALSHLTGYTGKINQEELEKYSNDFYELSDYIGKDGLELFYEKILKGKSGKKQVEINSKGEEIKIIAEEKAIDGKDLTLTLDFDLQKKVYEILKKYGESSEGKGGAAVIMDSRNGEILSLVSWPGFDINKFVKGISQEEYKILLEDEKKPLFDRTISAEYPTGSTFKLITASAALQEGVINEFTEVNSTGGIQLNILYKDWKTGGHGITNVRKGLAESVNTFFYIAGGGIYHEDTLEIEGGLGIDRISKYAKEFGLGQLTEIDLTGEKQGFFPTKEWKGAKGETWYIGNTYNVSIGQGDILATPLQVANYTAAVANNGTLYRPKLLKDKNDKILNQNFIDSSYLKIVREGMREAVVYGTAKNLNNLPIEIAAKTGTAQHGSSDKNHSWLTAFFPYDNPEIVITIIVEEGGESTETALPAAKEILSWYFSERS